LAPGALLGWALALWIVAVSMFLASSLVAFLNRREGVTIGRLWFAGTSAYRNLESFVQPVAARWSRLLALLGCFVALSAVAVLLFVWSTRAA
jgi:hypothetical protein